jgi:hypothetical protein
MTLPRATLLLLFLPALADAAPAPLPREKRHAESNPWSAPVDGLRVRLIARQKRYRAGDTVRLVLEIQNVSGSDRAIAGPELHPTITERSPPGWSITCSREGGGVSRRRGLEDLKRESEWNKLPAGGTLRLEIAARAGWDEEKRQDRLKVEDEPRLEELHFPDGDTAGVYVLRAVFAPEGRGREIAPKGTWGTTSLVSPPVWIEMEK